MNDKLAKLPGALVERLLFFFLVALELKRELVLGELGHPRVAALSIAAAAGGMQAVIAYPAPCRCQLFIANLAFGPESIGQAKLGIFAASLVSAAAGLLLLGASSRIPSRIEHRRLTHAR